MTNSLGAATPKSQTTAGLFMLFNFAASVGIIAVNKAVFKTYGYGFPTFVTSLHFVCTFAGLAVCAALGVFEVKRAPFRDVIPLSLAFTGFVVFNNLSLQYNSLGFYQLMKVLTTPVVIAIQRFVFGVPQHWHLTVSLIPVCIGVALASVSDVELNLWGTVWAVAGIVSTSLYQIWIKAKQQDLQLNSYQLLFLQTPTSAALVFAISLATEPWLPGPVSSNASSSILGFPYSSMAVAAIAASALLSFAVNLSIFLVIGKTSPVAYNVLGHFKLVCILLTGVFIFSEPMDVTKGTGTALTLAGVFAFTHLQQSRSSGWDKREQATSNLRPSAHEQARQQASEQARDSDEERDSHHLLKLDSMSPSTRLANKLMRHTWMQQFQRSRSSQMACAAAAALAVFLVAGSLLSHSVAPSTLSYSIASAIPNVGRWQHLHVAVAVLRPTDREHLLPHLQTWLHVQTMSAADSSSSVLPAPLALQFHIVHREDQEALRTWLLAELPLCAADTPLCTLTFHALGQLAETEALLLLRLVRDDVAWKLALPMLLRQSGLQRGNVAGGSEHPRIILAADIETRITKDPRSLHRLTRELTAAPESMLIAAPDDSHRGWYAGTRTARCARATTASGSVGRDDVASACTAKAEDEPPRTSPFPGPYGMDTSLLLLHVERLLHKHHEVMATAHSVLTTWNQTMLLGESDLLNGIVSSLDTTGTTAAPRTSTTSSAIHPADFPTSRTWMPVEWEEWPIAAPAATPPLLVVVASGHENTSWIEQASSPYHPELPSPLPHLIYATLPSVSTPVERIRLRTYSNEASVFLHYIVHNYDRLPPRMVFMHAHAQSWHADNQDMLRRLRFDLELPLHDDELVKRARAIAGAVELPLEMDDESRARRFGYVSLNLHVPVNYDRASTNPSETHKLTVEQFDDLWQYAELSEWVGPQPEHLRYFCCAQFYVHRHRIRRWPLVVWRRLYEWSQRSTHQAQISGRVFEYIWHALMGEPYFLQVESTTKPEENCQIPFSRVLHTEL